MYKHLSSYELPILFGRFTAGFSGETWWGTGTDGNVYQVIDNGEWLLFGKMRSSGGVDSHVRMAHKEFDKLFRV